MKMTYLWLANQKRLKKFRGVYYGLVHDAKGTYAKRTMVKDVKKLVEGYGNYMGCYLRTQKSPGAPGTTLSKIDLEYPDNKNKYR